MNELPNSFSEKASQALRYIEGLIFSNRYGNKEQSEDVEGLLSEGRIEQLVQELRPPFQIGMKGSSAETMQPYYQVPPKDFDMTKLKDIWNTTGGAYVFEFFDGTQLMGTLFTLTNEQAAEVDARTEAELERLGMDKSYVIHTK